MTRIGLFVPSPAGQVHVRTRHTELQDVAWCIAEGFGWLDVCALVRPGSSVEQQRNQAVLRAASAECSHLRMIDADVWCPWDQSLMASLWPALSDPAAVAAGAVVPVRGGSEGKLNVHPVSAEAQYEAQYVSAAALLVDLGRLARLQWPPEESFFRRHWNRSQTTCLVDEGYHFSSIVRNAGGKMVACNVDICHGDAHSRRVSGSQEPTANGWNTERGPIAAVMNGDGSRR